MHGVGDVNRSANQVKYVKNLDEVVRMSSPQEKYSLFYIVLSTPCAHASVLTT